MSDKPKCMIRPRCQNTPTTSFPWDGKTMLACSEHTKTAIATAQRIGRVIKPLPLALPPPAAAVKPPAEPPARPSRSSSTTTTKPGR